MGLSAVPLHAGTTHFFSTTVGNTQTDTDRLSCSVCESYLSHLASIEKVFHDEQVQFLLRVVLGVLVTNPVNTQDLCQCSRSL